MRKLRAEREDDFAKGDHSDPVRRDRSGAILLFVGPPGVGKTSLGASIARAMGREFIRMSLGGIRDEAEIRGFRRTYIGAMPGRIIQAIRRVKSRNPLIMLDEVDKLGRDFRGDPGLGAAGGARPRAERRIPRSLSRCRFRPERCHVHHHRQFAGYDPRSPARPHGGSFSLSGYTEREKGAIAAQYLAPRQRRENGLRSEELDFTEEALLKIIRDYTREAGVRHLEREIGKAARKVVTRIAEGVVESIVVTEDKLTDLLGKARFGHRSELQDRTEIPRRRHRACLDADGGRRPLYRGDHDERRQGLRIHRAAGRDHAGKRQDRLQFRAFRGRRRWASIPPFSPNTTFTCTCRAGAVPKDGPSAGVTMATALASLLTARTAKSNIAMTGELTLSGQVLPVGGIKDKVLAAHRLGADTVILPRKNENDLDDVPDDVRGDLNFILVEHLDEVLDVALVDPFALAEAAPEQPVSH